MGEILSELSDDFAQVATEPVRDDSATVGGWAWGNYPQPEATVSYSITGYANPEWRTGKLKRVGKLLIAAVMLAFIIFGFLSVIEGEQSKQAIAEMQIKQAEQRIMEAESRAREAEAQAKVDTELARQDGKTERAQTYSLALVALSAGFNGTMDMLLFLGFMFIAALAIPAEIIFLKRKGWL